MKTCTATISHAAHAEPSSNNINPNNPQPFLGFKMNAMIENIKPSPQTFHHNIVINIVILLGSPISIILTNI